VDLQGENNSKLNLVKNSYREITITSRGNQIKLFGEKKYTQRAKADIEAMIRIIRNEQELTIQLVEDILKGGNPHEVLLGNGTSNTTIVYGRNGKPIKAKTVNQKKLVEMVLKKDIVFAIGPAGTGKTYIAVAMATKALKDRIVKKIILTRPAVEAGESLGFLPGDLKDKVDPYLRPLYDALDDMFPLEKLDYFMQTRVIEVAPLAYMRGRTLDNAFVILDEAQNTTPSQLKMFLTRLGPSAKCIITGDLTQIDLPRHQKSGLISALDVLRNIEGIGRVNLSAEDVVRHRLVKDIIRAYEKNSEDKKAERMKKETAFLETREDKK
jgi:phosphate starvation-inducible PhoH-like protein